MAAFMVGLGVIGRSLGLGEGSACSEAASLRATGFGLKPGLILEVFEDFLGVVMGVRLILEPRFSCAPV